MPSQLLAHVLVAATAIGLIARILRRAARRPVVGPAGAGSPLAAPSSKRLRVRMGIVQKQLDLAEAWELDPDDDPLLMAHIDDELRRLAEETAAREKAEASR